MIRSHRLPIQRPSLGSDPFDQLFRQFFGDLLPTPAPLPRINIRDEEDALVVSALVPGVDPDKLDVQLEHGLLTIRGEVTSESADESARTVRRERQTGEFRRQVRIRTPIDAGSVDAKVQDGVLTVTMPKAPESRARTIPVELG